MQVICVEHPFICFSLKPGDKKLQLLKWSPLTITITITITRSTGKLLLDHPKGKMLTTLGARSFSAAAPKLWNELPVELRQATSLNSFKSRLKTYLFKKYFL